MSSIHYDPDERVSEHFTLQELAKSQTAVRRGFDNVPDLKAYQALKCLADNILEPVRDAFGIPFSPSSGYRSPRVNALIGSRPTSQHVRGEAVDFEIPGLDNLTVAYWIQQNLDFDQLILEFYRPGQPSSGWIHCSYREGRNRNRVLTITRAGVETGLPVQEVA